MLCLIVNTDPSVVELVSSMHKLRPFWPKPLPDLMRLFEVASNPEISYTEEKDVNADAFWKLFQSGANN